MGETEEYDEELKGTLMVGERRGKCNDKYWITPVLNLAQSSVSPAERERERESQGETKEGGKGVRVISAE